MKSRKITDMFAKARPSGQPATSGHDVLRPVSPNVANASRAVQLEEHFNKKLSGDENSLNTNSSQERRRAVDGSDDGSGDLVAFPARETLSGNERNPSAKAPQERRRVVNDSDGISFGDENILATEAFQKRRRVVDGSDGNGDLVTSPVKGILSGDERIPITNTSRKRRRVVLDSDDDEEVPSMKDVPSDGDKDIITNPFGGKCRRVVHDSADDDEQTTPSVTGSLPKREQLALAATANLPELTGEQLAALQELVDLEDDGEIEEAPEEEVGDNELVLGPDEFAEELANQAVLPIVVDAIKSTDTPFAQKLRKTIEALASWTRGHDIRALADDNRPMTFGYWSLLGRLSIDDLVARYLAGISHEVQHVFEKSSWCAQDFLSPPAIEGDQRQAVYVNIATDNLRWKTAIGCEPYIGSTGCGDRREGQHLSIARNYSPGGLPQRYRRSFHYLQICRHGVQSDFRLLAAFDRPIEAGYLLLLEGIFMILLQSYRHPGYLTSYSTEASYDMTASIRESLGLPRVDWKGMNAAWPLYQGFSNKNTKSPLPCANPECGKMTYPNSNRPEGVKGSRNHLDRGDPLGPYICPTCAYFRRRLGQLPDKAVIDRVDKYREQTAELRKQRAKLRQAAGPDAQCGCCGRVESQAPPKVESWRVSTLRRHRVHEKFTDMLLCNSCYDFVENNDRLRTPKELAIHDAIMAKKDLQNSGDVLVCENCQGSMGDPECGGRFRNRTIDGNTTMLLCNNCHASYTKSGQLRSPQSVAFSRLARQVKERRIAHTEILCDTCGGVEGKFGNTRDFLVKMSDPPYIECWNCDDL